MPLLKSRLPSLSRCRRGTHQIGDFAVTAFKRDVKRSFAPIITRGWIRARCQQNADGFGVSAPRGTPQRSPAMMIGGRERIGSGFDECRDHFGVSTVGGSDHRRLSARRFRIKVGAPLEKDAHRLDMTHLRRIRERRPAVVSRLSVYVRPSANQKANDFIVPFARRQHQRGASLVIRRVYRLT